MFSGDSILGRTVFQDRKLLVKGPFNDERTQETVPCYYSVEAKNQQQMDFQHTLPIVHLNVDTVTIR